MLLPRRTVSRTTVSRCLASPVDLFELGRQYLPIRSLSSEDVDTSKELEKPFAKQFLLHKSIKKSMEMAKFTHMTDIQRKTYQAGLEGRDLLAISPKCSGKTLSYMLPFLQTRLLGHNTLPKGVHMVVLLSDSKEAQYVYDEITTYLRLMGPNITVQCLSEEESYERQVVRLVKKIPTIVVATPSRLRLHIQQTKLVKKKRKGGIQSQKMFHRYFTELTTTLVLDECISVVQNERSNLDWLLDNEWVQKQPQRHTLMVSSRTPEPDEWELLQPYVSADYFAVNLIPPAPTVRLPRPAPRKIVTVPLERVHEHYVIHEDEHQPFVHPYWNDGNSKLHHLYRNPVKQKQDRAAADAVDVSKLNSAPSAFLSSVQFRLEEETSNDTRESGSGNLATKE